MKEHPDFEYIDLDSFQVTLKEPANYSIQIATESIPLVLDLEPLLIVE